LFLQSKFCDCLLRVGDYIFLFSLSQFRSNTGVQIRVGNPLSKMMRVQFFIGTLEFFSSPQCLEGHWGPPSPISSGYWCLFP